MSLQDWVPEVGEYLSLAEVIEFAFDYRGNTTIVRRDGTEIVGYVFNRNAAAPEPYVQVFDEAGEGPFRIPYADIVNIKFTGRDMAAGGSWKAWLERRESERRESSGPRRAAM